VLTIVLLVEELIANGVTTLPLELIARVSFTVKESFI
jgi:hypothetical protein